MNKILDSPEFVRGGYSLIKGDCVEGLKRIDNESIDLILTDIPYNISKSNNFKTMKDRTGRNGIDFGEWDKDFDVNILSELPKLLKPNGSLIIFCSIDQYHYIHKLLSPYLELKDRLTWEKSNPMPRNRDRRYINNTEVFFWYVKKKAKWTFHRQNEKYDGSVLKYPSESGGGFKRYHPCQKNVNMLIELLKRHTNPNDIVLDPFMGSGSTGVACINTSRRFIGIEIDDTYFETAKKRIESIANDIKNENKTEV